MLICLYSDSRVVGLCKNDNSRFVFHGRRRTYFWTTLQTVIKKWCISCQMRRRWVMDWPKTLFSHTDIGPTRFETSENVSYKKINFGFEFIVQIIFRLYVLLKWIWFIEQKVIASFFFLPYMCQSGLLFFYVLWKMVSKFEEYS